MDTESTLLKARRALAEQNDIDAWFLYDFRGKNEYLWQFLGETSHLTRRCFVIVYPNATPSAVVSFVDKPQFPSRQDLAVSYYSTWQEFDNAFKQALQGLKRVAMEYSLGGDLPTASFVDGGVIDKVRSLGVTPVSSATLFQKVVATWTPDGLRSHHSAVKHVYNALNSSLDLIRTSVSGGRQINEYDVQQHILQYFKDNRLETEETPIVSVNQHSAACHYQPSLDTHWPINKGDLVLIDLWAREPGRQNIYADVTWVANVGPDIKPGVTEAFDAVIKSRDAVVNELEERWADGFPVIEGWELDDIAASVLVDCGYESYIRHGTGHSIGPGRFLHGLSVNLDDYETRDTRPLQTGVGFSVEPGVYLPEFGVRSEINVYLDPTLGPTVTTPRQTSIQVLEIE